MCPVTSGESRQASRSHGLPTRRAIMNAMTAPISVPISVYTGPHSPKVKPTVSP